MLIPRPLYVFIEPFFDPDMSPGGIIIPDSAKGRCDQGIIKYVGSDCRWLKVGMYVLFSGYAGETIEFGEEGLLISMHESLVVAEITSPDMQELEVSGLYHLEKNKSGGRGDPFPATVESAIGLIADEIHRWTNIRSVSNSIKGDYKLDLSHDQIKSLPYCKEASDDD